MPVKTDQIKKEKKQTLAELFLVLFVKNLVANSRVLEKSEKTDEEYEIVTKPIPVFSVQELPKKRSNAQLRKMGLPQQPKTLDAARLPKQKVIRQIPKRVHIALPIYGAEPLIAPPLRSLPQILPTPSAFMPSAKQLVQKIQLGKIASLLMDPAVFSVECPGPGKNILVNRSGEIQTTPVILTKEEIDTIINTISDITRIPVIPGVFKSSLQDLLVTAVVSEYVGTRFIIQKKLPRGMMEMRY